MCEQEEYRPDEQNLHWSARQRLLELLGTTRESELYQPFRQCIGDMRRAYVKQRDRTAELQAALARTISFIHSNSAPCPQDCTEFHEPADCPYDWYKCVPVRAMECWEAYFMQEAEQEERDE